METLSNFAPLYIEGSQVVISIIIEFLSLKILFVLVNSADSDEILPYATFHLNLYCNSTRLRVSYLEGVGHVRRHICVQHPLKTFVYITSLKYLYYLKRKSQSDCGIYVFFTDGQNKRYCYNSNFVRLAQSGQRLCYSFPAKHYI